MKISYVFGFVFLSILFSGYAEEGHPRHLRGKVDIHVVDDLSIPVSNATVTAHFRVLSNADYTGPTIENKTDTNGICVVEGEGCEYLGVWVHKNGYYDSRHRIPLGDYEKAKKTKLWPINEYTVVLKKRRHPISMYVKRVAITVPKINEPIGYDLQKGDWISPYGQGETTDFTITVTGRINTFSDRQVWCKVNFTGKFDGVQTCKIEPFKTGFKSLYTAPLDGYTQNYIYEKKVNSNRKEWINAYNRDDAYLIVRTRSVVDKEGKLVQANYGKIYYDFVCDFEDKETIGVYFTYYFNPTPNDRNLEFAPKKSLFPKSRFTDIVTP